MTRLECELKLIELAEQAMEVLREYAPDGDRLGISVVRGQINVTALFKDTDVQNADYKDVDNTYSVFATKYSDGAVWFSDKWRGVWEETA